MYFKPITDVTNNAMAKSLRSATTTIDVSASTAPSSGQVLTASISTSASWQSITTSLISDYTITDLKCYCRMEQNGLITHQFLPVLLYYNRDISNCH